MKFFATSSIDALIHAIESFISPKASRFSEMFSINAITTILNGYSYIRDNGAEARIDVLGEFLTASTTAGVAFQNAGCGTVHAMSYPLSASYHIPHGEANYVMFIPVFKKYMEIKSDGKIVRLNEIIAKILGCEIDKVYDELETLFSILLEKKNLSEYGVTVKDLEQFADIVIEHQRRLMSNSFVPLDRNQLLEIY